MTFYTLKLKKGKVKVMNQTMKTRNIFCLKTKDSQITKNMGWLEFSLLPGNCPGKYPYKIVSQQER